jgi:hypothetical protein
MERERSMRFTEQTRKKMSEAARRRWRERSEEEKQALSTNQSELMKLYWLLKTPEERRAQARKAALTRRENRNAKAD